MKTKPRHKVRHLAVKFVLGLATLVVGLICAVYVMFQRTESVGIQYTFGGLNRYVLGLSSIIAIVAGAMLLNDAWVLREILKGRYELPTYDAIVKAYQALYSVYLSKSKSKDEVEEEKVKGEKEEEEERVIVQVSH